MRSTSNAAGKREKWRRERGAQKIILLAEWGRRLWVCFFLAEARAKLLIKFWHVGPSFEKLDSWELEKMGCRSFLSCFTRPLPPERKLSTRSSNLPGRTTFRGAEVAVLKRVIKRLMSSECQYCREFEEVVCFNWVCATIQGIRVQWRRDLMLN